MLFGLPLARFAVLLAGFSVLTLSAVASGGGVITINPGSGIASDPGTVEITIIPPAAFQAGADWKLSTLADSDYSTQNPSAFSVTWASAAQLQFNHKPHRTKL